MMGDSNTCPQANSVHLFVVIGAQRTGTNLLREILNTNEQIAMLGEVFMPSPAPAHWDNFCRTLPVCGVQPATYADAESLLDQYFEFVEYRIRNHWKGNTKSSSDVFGVDIKYNQLTAIVPADRNPTSPTPFILSYLRRRGATLIHTTRNVIHCAISALIALQRNFWHNYEGAAIKHSYHIDPEECLAYARTIVRHRDLFLAAAQGCKVVNCRYEGLLGDIERGGRQAGIPDGPGPLRDIAAALGVPFRFRHDGRLQRAIDIPYSRLLSNYDALSSRLHDSEFLEFVSTLV
jgi:LPS sulfotransferase NodH